MAGCFRLFPDCQSSDDFPLGNDDYGRCDSGNKKDTKTPMLINLGANGTNILLNIVFIYGMDLGVRGAAIASAISYTTAGLLMFAAYRRNEYLHWKWEHFAVDGKVMKECMRNWSAGPFSSIASCFGYVVFAGLVSGMGTTIFAAHSIAVTGETIFYISGYGLERQPLP